MKKVIVHHAAELGFDQLNIIQQRSAVILGTNLYKYTTTSTTISDLEGKGWYLGKYNKCPHLSSSGKIYWKTICTGSVTYKKGKFYGNITPRELLEFLKEYIPEFEFCKNFGLRYIPDHVIRAILDRKITSQEDVWKRIAHVSYKDKHWKLIRFCRLSAMNPIFMKLACKDYEDVINHPDLEDNQLFRDLLTYAVITGNKVSCKWSQSRMQQEITDLRRIVTRFEIEAKDQTPIYNLDCIDKDLLKDFVIVNTEREAFETSQLFHNCVYNNYWNRIKNHRYLVVHNNEFCIGYQILNGEDLLFDQIHGTYNSHVDDETRNKYLTKVRPELEKLLPQIHIRVLGTKEDYPEELPDIDILNIF